MTTAKLITKISPLSGRQAWAVEFDYHGRLYRTGFSTFREEACAWGRIIEKTGWCMSARPGPAE